MMRMRRRRTMMRMRMRSEKREVLAGSLHWSSFLLCVPGCSSHHSTPCFSLLLTSAKNRPSSFHLSYAWRKSLLDFILLTQQWASKPAGSRNGQYNLQFIFGHTCTTHTRSHMHDACNPTANSRHCPRLHEARCSCCANFICSTRLQHREAGKEGLPLGKARGK